MAALSANSWLDILLKQTYGSSASVQPVLGSLNLSTTVPQTTPIPTANLQSEISAMVTVAGKYFTVSSGGGYSLQVSTATNLATVAPTLLSRVQFGAAPNANTFWKSQSVATSGSLVAVALSPNDYLVNGGKGIVRFYRANESGVLTFLKDVNVGYLPDSIAFNANGTKLVVCNEAEPTVNYIIEGVGVDRAGSVGIIDIKSPTGTPTFKYTDLTFEGLTLPAGIRISGKAGVSTQGSDIEPEYVSINGIYAYVTLQENNGVAKVNLLTNAIEKIFALGTVDFSKQLVDLSDRDDADGKGVLIKPTLGNNALGLRMADGIAAYSVGTRSFFATANEGDSREWGSYLDEVRRAGPGNRLKTISDLNTVPYTAFGSRSVSVFDATTGDLLWDSGNTLQSLAIAHGVYDDSRSDDKGTEPEGVVVAMIGTRSYLIVGQERTRKSLLAVFDVTDPTKVTYVTSLVLPTSLSAEGMAYPFRGWNDHSRHGSSDYSSSRGKSDQWFVLTSSGIWQQ